MIKAVAVVFCTRERKRECVCVLAEVIPSQRVLDKLISPCHFGSLY